MLDFAPGSAGTGANGLTGRPSGALDVLGLIATILALALTATGFRAAGTQGELAARAPSARLQVLALLALTALVAAHLAGIVPARPIAVLIGLLLAVILGTAAAIILSLALPGSSRWRLRLLRLPAAALAVIMAIAGDVPLALIAVFLLPVTLRMPWLDRSVGLRRRAVMLAGAFAALLAGGAAAGALPVLPRGLTSVLSFTGGALFSFAAALLVNLLIQFPGRIFDRFRLRTRLITSYIFVAATPVLLIALFLIIAAYLSFGSERAVLAARLLAPGGEVERGLERALADPALERALATGGGPGVAAPAELAALARRSLAPPARFLAATRRSLADTTRFVLHLAPRDSLPQEIALLSEPLPPHPPMLAVYAGNQLYLTTGVSRRNADDETMLRAFVPLDSVRLRDVAESLGGEILIVTSDSLTVDADRGGVQITISGTQRGHPVVVTGTERETGGGYSGAQILYGVAIDSSGALRQQDSILLVKTPTLRLLTALRDTATNPLNAVLLIALAVIGGLFLLVEVASLAVGAGIARSIHGAIAALHQGARRLAADDNLDQPILIERGDELGELADAFNSMVLGLRERRRLAIEREVMKSELLVAQSIQRRLFPATVPAIPGLDVAGTSIPSREVGGDAYDFMRWGEGLLVSVADVAGKGVPAALLMSNLHAGLRGQAHRPGHLNQVLSELNDLVIASTEPGRFITVAIALIEPGTDALVYASAGHNGPLARRADGTIECLDQGGILLGVMPDATYEETRAPFTAGDVLVLYTDGVIEALNAGGEFFGDERLREVLAAVDGLSAAAVRDRIVENVRSFTGAEGLADDLTVVVVRRT